MLFTAEREVGGSTTIDRRPHVGTLNGVEGGTGRPEPPITPLLPPAVGWWLAREASGVFRSTGLAYVRRLSSAEVRALNEALAYFGGLWGRPGVASLLSRHDSWMRALEAAAGSRYLGPLNEDWTMRALEELLPTWRMALDFLKRAVETQFGKDSVEARAYRAATNRAYDKYFGYRLIEALRNAHLHHSIPPVRQHVTFDVITCDRCGQEHYVNPKLVLELPREYFLDLDKCPASLKRQLPNMPQYLDLRAAVTEAMRGFFDVLFAFALTDPTTSAHVDALITVSAEVEPDQPLLVHLLEAGPSPRVASSSLTTVGWVVRRARANPVGDRPKP
jgi:hypothetical protein